MILEENYLKIYVYDKWGEKNIPLYQEGETFIPTKMQMTSGKTSPPKPLTEPDLIGLMDKNGIGTDATIHEHIKKIKDREYIYEERHYLYPTTLGVALIEGYNSVESNVSLTKPNLRKMLEESLQSICRGQQNKNDVLRNDLTLYKDIFETINREENKISQAIEKYLKIKADYSALQESKFHNKEVIMPCPVCDEFITLKQISNDNKLIGCKNNNSEEKHVIIIIQKVKYDSIKVTNERCDKCINGPRKIKIVFSNEMVDKGFPKEYTGCICGCDEIMNKAIKPNPKVLKTFSEAIEKDVELPPLPSSFNYNNNNNNNNDNNNNNNNTYNRNNYTNNNNRINYTNNTNTNNSNNSASTSYSNTNSNNYGSSSSSSFTTANNYNSGFTTARTYNNNNNTNNSRDNDNVNPPNCPFCKQPATELTVTKENNNKGRKFYTCKNEGCDFFKWKDDHIKEINSPGIHEILKEEFDNMANINGNKPRCNCGLVAIARRVSKEGPNKGRIFLACRSQTKKCRYFEWADEMNISKAIIESCMDQSLSHSSSSFSVSNYKRKRNSTSSASASTSTSTNKRKSTTKRTYTKRSKK